MAKIIDLDDIAQTTDVVINTTAKTVQIVTTGAVSNAYPGSTSGITLQCLYSFLKEEWKTDAALNKFKFPLKMYTKTDGTFINSWVFADATSRNVIRDGGWTEGANQYAGIVSLGSFSVSTDQAYYSNVTGYDQTSTDFDKSGNLNEAILISGFTGYLKTFLRIEGKLPSEYNLLTEQSISALEPVLYKLPLANSADLKTSETDANIAINTPYTNMKINYLAGTGFTTAAVQSYVTGAVVLDGADRWAFCTAGGTLTGGETGGWATFTGTATWEAYSGEVQIGATYYAFNRIINGGTGTDREIYDWAQAQLRVTDDINAADSTPIGQRSGLTMNGNLAELLVEYVGDTLKTKGGVMITNFDSDSTNNMKFRPIMPDTGGLDAVTHVPVVATTEVNYPYVATGNLSFSANLVSEEAGTDHNTKYTMYFENDDAATSPLGYDFDTANAIIVKNNSNADITGEVDSALIGFTYDYDNNIQEGLVLVQKMLLL